MKNKKLTLITGIVVALWIIGQIVFIVQDWNVKHPSDCANYITFAQDCYDEGVLYPSDAQIENEAGVTYSGWVNLLALQIKLFGSTDYYRVVNLLLNVFYLLFIYLIAHRVAGDKIALITVMCFCLLYVNYKMPLHPLTDLPFVFFTYLSILLVKKKHIMLFLSGLLIGYANFIRPMSFLFVIAVLVFMLLYKYNYKFFLSYLGGIVFIALSLFIICKVTDNNFISATTGGANLIMGANDDANGAFDAAVFGEGEIGYIENREQYNSIQEDSIWKERAVDWILSHPVQYISLMPLKIYHSWKGENYVDHETSAYGEEHTLLIKLLRSSTYYIIIFLAFIGIYYQRKKWKSIWGIILIPTILGTIMVSLIVGSPRYHYIFMPAILIYAAYAIEMLYKKRTKQSAIVIEKE